MLLQQKTPNRTGRGSLPSTFFLAGRSRLFELYVVYYISFGIPMSYKI
ncbi:hypothetical protein HMPREF1250_1503 [Megasphaera vaginalis (ex Srinivasan et al. 2021)]|uniref:Uncharacterized protein n=1 Tax=Megasphaera vaginalis (ex Srinivasan et al. 2021) TaxID=1111454 RepID=U7UB10_9FIRM|nr:hypothetical protein HMPREF1250_1503 [Megasphaera vaginalis (ex Srinivasan et al. 2021)]